MLPESAIEPLAHIAEVLIRQVPYPNLTIHVAQVSADQDCPRFLILVSGVGLLHNKYRERRTRPRTTSYGVYGPESPLELVLSLLRLGSPDDFLDSLEDREAVNLLTFNEAEIVIAPSDWTPPMVVLYAELRIDSGPVWPAGTWFRAVDQCIVFDPQTHSFKRPGRRSILRP